MAEWWTYFRLSSLRLRRKYKIKTFPYQLHRSDCFNFSVLYFWCSCICVVCCACFTKDPRFILHRVVSFFGEIIVFISVPLRECVPWSHFSRFLWERITRWNSFWNGLVPSHLGTRLPISLSACLLYLFPISISKGKKEKNKKYNNY